MTLTGRRSLLMTQELAILQIPTMREYLTSLYLKQRTQRRTKRGRNERLDLCQVNALCNTRYRAPGSDTIMNHYWITFCSNVIHSSPQLTQRLLYTEKELKDIRILLTI